MKVFEREEKIFSMEQLETIIRDVENCRNDTGGGYMHFYRGQPSNNMLLEPKICRNFVDAVKIIKNEKIIFEEFTKAVEKKKIIIPDNSFIEKYPEVYNWELLFQGQHLRLKTRLLDWTINWEMALQFALSDDNYLSDDAQFWIFLCPESHEINNDRYDLIYSQNPFEINDWYIINPPLFQDDNNNTTIASRRIARQHGRFFIQPTEKIKIPVEEQEDINKYLFKCIIPREVKGKIKAELDKRIKPLCWANYIENKEITQLMCDINNQV